MLTPIEIQRKSFKNGGFGYDKKEVDVFLDELRADYETLYKENVEFKDKISVLSDGLQYYKSIEKTLQKALVLAQKTADDTHEDAVKKADAIEREAHLKAEQILQESRRELEKIHAQAEELVRSYDNYKANFKSMVNAQADFIDSSSMKAAACDLEGFLKMEKPLKDLRIEEHEAGIDYNSEGQDGTELDDLSADKTDGSETEDALNLDDLVKIKNQVNKIEKTDGK